MDPRVIKLSKVLASTGNDISTIFMDCKDKVGSSDIVALICILCKNKEELLNVHFHPRSIIEIFKNEPIYLKFIFEFMDRTLELYSYHFSNLINKESLNVYYKYSPESFEKNNLQELSPNLLKYCLSKGYINKHDYLRILYDDGKYGYDKVDELMAKRGKKSFYSEYFNLSTRDKMGLYERLFDEMDDTIIKILVRLFNEYIEDFCNGIAFSNIIVFSRRTINILKNKIEGIEELDEFKEIESIRSYLDN